MAGSVTGTDGNNSRWLQRNPRAGLVRSRPATVRRVTSSLRDPVRGPLRIASDRVSERTKHAVRRVLPAWAWYAYMRASGYLPAPVDDTPLERIERERPERLADPDYLAEELLPAMGLNGTSPHLFPERLAPYL